MTEADNTRKVCGHKDCPYNGEPLDLVNFNKGRGPHGRHVWCRVCQSRVEKRRYHWRVATPAGVTDRLFWKAKERAKKRGEEFLLKLPELLDLVTRTSSFHGIPFDNSPANGKQRMWCCSLDKVDPSGVYEIGNIQLVPFWFNVAKGSWPEQDLWDAIKVLYEAIEKEKADA